MFCAEVSLIIIKSEKNSSEKKQRCVYGAFGNSFGAIEIILCRRSTAIARHMVKKSIGRTAGKHADQYRCEKRAEAVRFVVVRKER